MKFLKLIFKNSFRNSTRSALGIIGISIGIIAIISLGLISSGLQDSTQSKLSEGAGEITVTKLGSSSFMDYDFIHEIENISDVNKVAGILTISDSPTGGTMSAGQMIGHGDEGVTIKGIDKNKLDLVGITATAINGSYFNENKNEVIMGSVMAENQNKTIGDEITIYGERFKVVGIYETGNMFEDSVSYSSLGSLQKLSDNERKISEVSVKVNNNTNLTKIKESINNLEPKKLTVISSEEKLERIDHVMETINVATLAISLLAILIGAIGVINTMIMSVYERTREIGVLRAVGWSSKRVLAMIVGETLMLTLISLVIGTIIAILIVGVGLPHISDALTISYDLDIFLRAAIITILVGLLGGLYPAYRAAKLSPMESLRYE